MRIAIRDGRVWLNLPTVTSWHQISSSFHANVDSVIELLDFDRVIIEVAIDGLRTLAQDLESSHRLHRAATLVKNRAHMLERVKDANSLRPKYETIFNQCVVLLVSYFDSAAHGAFRAGVVAALRSGVELPVANEALSVSWRGLERTEGEREAIFADLVVAQKNISFQDMRSIVRAFGDLLGIPLSRTVHTDNIILGQAARHVIVHAGSVVDAKMLKQVAGATSRTLKPMLSAGQPLRFSPAEVAELASSMKAYVDALSAALAAKFDEDTSG